MTPIKALTFGLAYDYAGLKKQAAGLGSYANAVGFYAHYQATDKLAFNSRAEWFTPVSVTGDWRTALQDPGAHRNGAIQPLG